MLDSQVFVFIYAKAYLVYSTRYDDPNSKFGDIVDSRKFKFPIERYLFELSKLKNLMCLAYLDCPKKDVQGIASALPV